MKFYLSIFLTLISLELFSQSDSLWKSPLTFEIQIGSTYRHYYSGYYHSTGSAEAYHMTYGNELGLRGSARLNKHISFVTRWKWAIYTKPEPVLKSAFQKEYPHLSFRVRSGRYRIQQLHTGIAWNIPHGKWSFELENYAGFSLIKIPELQVYGTGPDGVSLLLIRRKQRASLVSFYTTLAVKHHFSTRKYLVFRSEVVYHWIPYNRMVFDATYGLPHYFGGMNDNAHFQFSSQLGIGWSFGKRRD